MNTESTKESLLKRKICLSLNFFRSISPETRYTLLCALIFSVALMLRACAAGFSYEPLLDDSIQYMNYPTVPDYWQLILEQGLFSSRPLAALTDLFFVGQLRFCLLLPVLLLSIVHGISGALFGRLFRRYFQTGTVFIVFYALLPLGTEGTYWLSASSRIVPGLFFAALSATVLDLFITGGKKRYAVLFLVFELLSYGFYEQILVFSLTLTGLIFLRYRRQRRALIAFASFLLVIGYFLFTSQFSGGPMAGRMKILLPITPWYFRVFLPDLLRQIGAAFLKGGIRTLCLGAVRGFKFLFHSASGVLYTVCACGLSVALVFANLKRKPEAGDVKPSLLRTLLWGFLLALAPVSIYFVIENPYFSLRATVASFVGAGLIVDALFRICFSHKRVYAWISGALVLLCLISGASEIADYRATAANDTAICAEILKHEQDFSGRIGFLGLESENIPEQNYFYHEHVSSAASSDWALHGKLVSQKGGEIDYSPVPLGIKGFCFYHGWNTEMKRLSGFDALWAWEENTLIPLQIETEDSLYRLYRPDGSLYACVWEEDGWGYIRMGEAA